MAKSKGVQYKAIDFFCGGGGMTCGLRLAGIDNLNLYAEFLEGLNGFMEKNLVEKE